MLLGIFTLFINISIGISDDIKHNIRDIISFYEIYALVYAGIMITFENINV